MSLTEEDAELRDLVMERLESNGTLGKLRAQLRACVFLALENQKDVKTPAPLRNVRAKQLIADNEEGMLSAQLIEEFLRKLDLTAASSVFKPEVGLNSSTRETGGIQQAPGPVATPVTSHGSGMGSSESKPPLERSFAGISLEPESYKSSSESFSLSKKEKTSSSLHKESPDETEKSPTVGSFTPGVEEHLTPSAPEATANLQAFGSANILEHKDIAFEKPDLPKLNLGPLPSLGEAKKLPPLFGASANGIASTVGLSSTIKDGNNGSSKDNDIFKALDDLENDEKLTSNSSSSSSKSLSSSKKSSLSKKDVREKGLLAPIELSKAVSESDKGEKKESVVSKILNKIESFGGSDDSSDEIVEELEVADDLLKSESSKSQLSF